MSGKNKLRRFEENKTFESLLQPNFNDIFRKDYELKGKWRSDFFKNNNPIVLELGCGRGEYSINLAKEYPNKNIIGFDIKGARLWRGAKTASEENIKNVAFVRTKIEFICSFFEKNEVDEIWITFPDPQLKKERKRLTAPIFLNLYKQFLKDDGNINLKTDSKELYDYTNKLTKILELETTETDDNIYSSGIIDRFPILNIKTTYENIFLKENKKITFTKFKINNFEYCKDLKIDDE